jgi:hypothetical protein
VTCPSVHPVCAAIAYGVEQEKHPLRQGAEIKHGHIVDYPHIIDPLVAQQTAFNSIYFGAAFIKSMC